MRKLLPQANSLSTVVDVFIYFGFKKDCTIQDIAAFCNFEPRQAQYYLNACVYLDLVGEDERLTDFGQELLNNNAEIKKRIYERIICDDLIGRVFAHMVVFPNDDIKSFCVNLISNLYPEYGEAVVLRRSSTLISWCREVLEYVSL